MTDTHDMLLTLERLLAEASFKKLAVVPESEYRYAKRTMHAKAGIETAGGTFLYRAYATVGSGDTEAIVAAVNALPALIRSARREKVLETALREMLTDHDGGWCPLCKQARAALAPEEKP